MSRHFWSAALLTFLAYALAVALGLWAGLWFTLLIVPPLQIAWTFFCLIRIVQLRRSFRDNHNAPQSDRDSFGFSLGGLLSSCALFLFLVVLTQVA